MLATQNGRSNPVRISRKVWETDKVFSLDASLFQVQTLANLVGADPADAHRFQSAGLAAGYTNGRARNLEKIREEPDHRLVGLSIRGRCGERELDCIPHSAGDRVAFRPRMNL